VLGATLVAASLGLVILNSLQWGPAPPADYQISSSTLRYTPVLRAEGIAIPRIGLDSQIIDMSLRGGEWPVPNFAVAHLAESANPGDIGNAVFAGHVTDVFARLDELVLGDEIVLWAADDRHTFRVIETKTVRNTDTSVLADRPGQATVTLITCAGRWIPWDNDYDHRWIVVGEAVLG
jgi:LPXTG-site transpeptidase (sortase) family protein